MSFKATADSLFCHTDKRKKGKQISALFCCSTLKYLAKQELKGVTLFMTSSTKPLTYYRTSSYRRKVVLFWGHSGFYSVGSCRTPVSALCVPARRRSACRLLWTSTVDDSGQDFIQRTGGGRERAMRQRTDFYQLEGSQRRGGMKVMLMKEPVVLAF